MWILKDLFPALIAAWMANRLASFDCHPKPWSCVSVLLRNITILADMGISSAVPRYMLLAAVMNVMLKQSSALMLFINRAAALQHYATHHNLAEPTKIFSSFSTVTFTFATALAFVYCIFVTTFSAQLATILLCRAKNTALSYYVMDPIDFRILNSETMQVLLRAYLTQRGQVMTPQAVSGKIGIRLSVTYVLTGSDT